MNNIQFADLITKECHSIDVICADSLVVILSSSNIIENHEGTQVVVWHISDYFHFVRYLIMTLVL